jgi:hypothetical protein
MRFPNSDSKKKFVQGFFLAMQAENLLSKALNWQPKLAGNGGTLPCIALGLGKMFCTSFLNYARKSLLINKEGYENPEVCNELVLLHPDGRTILSFDSMLLLVST